MLFFFFLSTTDVCHLSPWEHLTSLCVFVCRAVWGLCLTPFIINDTVLGGSCIDVKALSTVKCSGCWKSLQITGSKQKEIGFSAISLLPRELQWIVSNRVLMKILDWGENCSSKFGMCPAEKEKKQLFHEKYGLSSVPKVSSTISPPPSLCFLKSSSCREAALF